ncbi:MAG: sigma-70 family RNA polymerase sigma factor [Planctomycetota bacterium]
MSQDTSTPRPSRTDEPLLTKVARGDRGAAEEVLDTYKGLVWSLAKRALETEADAEDATQEIFLEVWKSASRYDRSIASEATFIAMIARRRLIDRRRKIGRRPSEEGIYEDTATTDEPSTNLSQEDQETARIARDAMSELSQEQQRVLQLSIFHNQSHEKIATATGMPLGTVKTHARRGLIKLRSVIDERLRRSDSKDEVSA